MVLRHHRKHDGRKTCERHCYRRDGPGLDHGEKGPAVKKTPQRRKGLAQVNVHAARLRHHGGQLAIGKRRRDRQSAGEHPCHQHPTGAADEARHVGRNDEDPRADHHRDHHERGIEQAQALHKLLFRLLRGDGLAHFLISCRRALIAYARARRHPRWEKTNSAGTGKSARGKGPTAPPPTEAMCPKRPAHTPRCAGS